MSFIAVVTAPALAVLPKLAVSLIEIGIWHIFTIRYADDTTQPSFVRSWAEADADARIHLAMMAITRIAE